MTPRTVWVVLAVAAATGLAITGRARGWTDAPGGAAQLARYVGAALAIGVAGALDPAGSDIADAAPRPRWRRHTTSLVPAVVPLALTAAALLAWCLPHARRGVVAGLGLEAAVMTLAAVAGGAMSRERPGQPTPPAATAAVTGPMILLLLTPMAPARLALVVDPRSPTWSSAHLRWALLGIILLALIARIWADPGRPRRHHLPGGRRRPDVNEATTTTGGTVARESDVTPEPSTSVAGAVVRSLPVGRPVAASAPPGAPSPLSRSAP
jgi:fluoroquinolone transport system permease protein